MPVIGEYYAEPERVHLEPDTYAATITECAIIMDPTNPKAPLINNWGKSDIKFKVRIEGKFKPDGSPFEIQTKMAISYGQTGGTYARLAQLIQVITGIKCGDKAQRNVSTEQFVGAQVRVLTAVAEKGDRTYDNIVAFFAPKKAAAGTTAPTPAIPPAAKSAAAQLEEDLGDLPF